MVDLVFYDDLALTQIISNSLRTEGIILHTTGFS